MTLSNRLTILRIILAFVFMCILTWNGVIWKTSALILFLVASYTDFLDGWLAKRRNEVTNFGKLMDPIADKILTLSAFIIFIKMGLVEAWMVVIIILRELIITGLRLMALSKGEVIEASFAGKQKTVSQMFSIFLILLFMVFKESGIGVFNFWSDTFEYWYRQTIFMMMLITTGFTLISGFSYLLRNRKFLAS